MFSFDESKSNIGRLVEDFGNKLDIIKTDKYKEANVEDEFIKPLFKYLNWNISNEGIKNIANREFIVQAKGKGGKEPDYLLQLEGKPCFYMEAKHPKYNLFKEIRYIWQGYSYAYSTQASSERKKVDFSLLTDFEEFRLFDCTFKAEPKTVNNFAVIDWKYTDYIEKFGDLWEYFEKENVRKGSLVSLRINEKQIKENRIPPDKAFLYDIDDKEKGWRILLAKDIKKFNPELSPEFITSVIQLIIDRFVFIKVLSDREIEDDFLAQIVEQIGKASLRSDEGKLNDICNDLFAKMNKTYNGSIFERRNELDMVTLSNKTLHSILKSLLPENSRYNFKVIPVEILGTIYEQFLGKIVIATDKRVTIDEKPEVRKAGGVYYTPQYIVEYIVDNTVGTILSKCKTISQLLNIKICDPACGSGSFLLGAYDKLISWTVEYFFSKIKKEKEIPKKESELFYQDNDGNVRLTAKMKRDILKNCIYGVDIDLQAVEVTKMSLSLKALEDTRHDELYNEVDLFHETVLPDLSGNIKCGNSLIGTDFYDGKDWESVSEKDMIKVNAFDWGTQFPFIMPAGGFDVVIGNPPYIKIQGLQEYQPQAIPYLKAKYISASSGNIDIYVMFLERSFKLLNNNGLSGFILPHKFFQTDMGLKIREIISEKEGLRKIINFGANQVFASATTYTCLLFLSSTRNISFDYVKIDSGINLSDSLKTICYKSYPSELLKKEKWSFHSGAKGELLEKLELIPVKLENITRKIFVGLQTSADKIYVLKEIHKDVSESNKLSLFSPILDREIEIEKGLIKPFLMGKDIKKYQVPISNSYVIFPYIITEGNAEIMSPKYIQEQFPLGWFYLQENKKALENRENGKMKHATFYAYIYPKNLVEFEISKIMTPDITNGCNFTIDAKGEMYHTTTIYSLSFNKFANCHSNFYLAILNSKLMIFYIYNTGTVLRGNFTRFKPQYMNSFPIRTIDFSISSENDAHTKLIANVDQMLSTQKLLHTAQTDAEKRIHQQKVDIIDKQINALVYKLYDLTEEEIKIVEGDS